MKLLFENWRQFIKETENLPGPVLTPAVLRFMSTDEIEKLIKDADKQEDVLSRMKKNKLEVELSRRKMQQKLQAIRFGTSKPGRSAVEEEVDPNATIRFDPKEDPLEEANPELYRWLKNERGIRMLRYLGHGAFGKVYEVEMSDGNRRAMKVINKRLAGDQYRREEVNYNWVRENKEKLPEDVARYLPNIYKIEKDVIFEDEEWLLIFMEMMNPAPEEVTHQFLGTGNRGSEYAAERKEGRILKDPNAVYSLMPDLLRQAAVYIFRITGDDWETLSRMEAQALGPFLRGDRVDYPSELEPLGPLYYGNTTQIRKDLLNSIAHILHETLKDVEGYDSWYVGRAMMAIAESLDHKMNRAVVPVRYGNPPDDQLGGSSEEVQDVFPEIEGLMAAMKYLYGEGFEPNDIHYGNVMVRPGSGDLVITDVGHFRGLSALAAQETVSL
jgi:hypothetical protein